jgi:hypothetical protein
VFDWLAAPREKPSRGGTRPQARRRRVRRRIGRSRRGGASLTVMRAGGTLAVVLPGYPPDSEWVREASSSTIRREPSRLPRFCSCSPPNRPSILDCASRGGRGPRQPRLPGRCLRGRTQHAMTRSERVPDAEGRCVQRHRTHRRHGATPDGRSSCCSALDAGAPMRCCQQAMEPREKLLRLRMIAAPGRPRRERPPHDAAAGHRSDRARHRRPHPPRRAVRRLLRRPRPLQGIQRPVRLQRGRSRHPHAGPPAARCGQGVFARGLHRPHRRRRLHLQHRAGPDAAGVRGDPRGVRRADPVPVHGGRPPRRLLPRTGPPR